MIIKINNNKAIIDNKELDNMNLLYTINQAYPVEHRRVPNFYIRNILESNLFYKLDYNTYEYNGSLKKLEGLLIKRYEK